MASACWHVHVDASTLMDLGMMMAAMDSLAK